MSLTTHLKRVKGNVLRNVLHEQENVFVIQDTCNLALPPFHIIKANLVTVLINVKFQEEFHSNNYSTKTGIANVKNPYFP